MVRNYPKIESFKTILTRVQTWVQQLNRLKNSGWVCEDLLHDAIKYERWMRQLHAYEQMVKGYRYLEIPGVQQALNLVAQPVDYVSVESFILFNKERYSQAASNTQVCINLDWDALAASGFGVEVENLRMLMIQADQACRQVNKIYYLTTIVPQRLDFIINSRKRCVSHFPLVNEAKDLAEVISNLNTLEQEVMRSVADQVSPLVLQLAQYQLNQIALAKQSKQMQYSCLVNSFEYCSQLQAFEHEQRIRELERQRLEAERRERERIQREQAELLRLELARQEAYHAQERARQERERLERERLQRERQQSQRPVVVVVEDTYAQQRAERERRDAEREAARAQDQKEQAQAKAREEERKRKEAEERARQVQLKAQEEQRKREAEEERNRQAAIKALEAENAQREQEYQAKLAEEARLAEQARIQEEAQARHDAMMESVHEANWR